MQNVVPQTTGNRKANRVKLTVTLCLAELEVPTTCMSCPLPLQIELARTCSPVILSVLASCLQAIPNTSTLMQDLAGSLSLPEACLDRPCSLPRREAFRPRCALDTLFCLARLPWRSSGW